MGLRTKMSNISIPVILPDDIRAVEVGLDPKNEEGKQIIITFKMEDGTTVTTIGELPTLATTGFEVAVASL